MEQSWSSLIKTLTGHSNWVAAVAFSPDGKQIASGSGDTTIKLWDSATGDLQETLTGHSSIVTAVAFSPDGKQIASGSRDTTIKLWDSATGDLQETLTGHSSSVTAIAFSPDGKQIASGSNDTTIKLWDSATGDLQKTLTGHSRAVTAIAFSPDSKQIASGSDDTTIKLWGTRTGYLQQTFASDSAYLKMSLKNEVKAIALSSEDSQIPSKFNNKSINSKLLGNVKKFWGALRKTPEIAKSIDESLSLETNRLKLELLNTLQVSKQWICYKALPVFFLSSDLDLSCYDVYCNRIAIGFQNGRVLCFEIDCVSLDSIFKIK